ncbi:reverse transcriptase domain-containing protein [Tanacetum coccineum]
MVVATKPRAIQSAILKARALTDQAVRNGSLKRSARTGKVFVTITNPVRKEYTGLEPKCTNYNFHHNPETPCRMCKNCNRLGHFAKDYRAGPRIVNPLNARNPTAARGACYEYGGTDHYKSECPRLNRALGRERNRPNQAMTIEGEDPKLEDIAIVRNFFEVFPDDLSGLPPS